MAYMVVVTSLSLCYSFVSEIFQLFTFVFTIIFLYIYFLSHASSPSFFALCQTGSRFGQVGMLVKMSYFLCPSPQPSVSVLLSSLKKTKTKQTKKKIMLK